MTERRKKIIKRILIASSILVLGLIVMPLPKDRTAYSKTVYDDNGQLLSATTSREGQWALPLTSHIPDHLAAAIVCYEDEYFYWHLGVNPISAIKAMATNARAGKIKRGGSTLPMQVMRMRHQRKGRNLANKLREMVFAIKYSIVRSKRSIIRDWAAIAPFGGNTIGVEAASLRYFGRNLNELSWAEYALLAVMPNNPTGVNIQRQQAKLKEKRDVLLEKLASRGYFQGADLEIYKDEDLPNDLFAIPQRAYHFLRFCATKEKNVFRYESTLDGALQDRVSALVQNEAGFLQTQDIHNMAAVVVDVTDNTLKAYVGNVNQANGGFSYNDLVQAQRSYGSLLKPLLYARAIEQFYHLPSEMVADIPTNIGDFRPENFDKKYRGAVALNDALIQSLNVPMVRLLYQMGYADFYQLIHKDLQIGGLDRGADHYGLSIILGGGETSLWELARVYKGLARNYAGILSPYDKINFLKEGLEESGQPKFAFGAYGISHLVDALTDLTRPREERSWELYAGQKKVAWKTGTSFGHRDAWSIGFSGKYMVAVWVGNETGESRTDLTGVLKAAPVMFSIFNLLNDDKWFDLRPGMKRGSLIKYCKESGKLAGNLCSNTAQMFLPTTSYRLQSCDKHAVKLVDKDGFIVSGSCEADAIGRDTIFTLSPAEAFYYEKAHDVYLRQNTVRPGCEPEQGSLKIIYPSQNLKIFLPREGEAKKPLLAQAYQPNKEGTLFWFLDGEYIESSSLEHSSSCKLEPGVGRHMLVVTDNFGNKGQVEFEILEGR